MTAGSARMRSPPHGARPLALLAALVLGACGAAFSPLPDQTRVVAPAAPATPQECVLGYWEHEDQDDHAGAAPYLTERYRASAARGRQAFEALGAAMVRLDAAVKKRFGPDVEQAAQIETGVFTVPRHAARKLAIAETSVHPDRAVVTAVILGPKRSPGIVADAQEFVLLRQNGAWYIDDPFSGTYVASSASAYVDDRAVINATAAREVEAIAHDVDTGAITQAQFQSRFSAAEQAEIDQDAIAGGVVDAIRRAVAADDWGALPVAGSLAEACRRVDVARDGRATAIELLRQMLVLKGWAGVAETLGTTRDADGLALPKARARLDRVEGRAGQATVEWLDAKGGLLEGAVYALTKVELTWSFAPSPDDPVFTVARPDAVTAVEQACAAMTFETRRLADDVAEGRIGQDEAAARVARLAESERQRRVTMAAAIARAAPSAVAR